MKTLSLKTKMALAISLLFAIVIALFAVGVLSYLEKSFKKAITDQQYAMVSNLAGNLDDKLRMAHNALITRSHSVPPAAISDPEQAQRFLDERSALLSLFDNGLFLISRDGKLIAETPYLAGRRGRDLSFREFYRHTLETGKPCISKPYISTHRPGHPAIFLAAPIFDSQGHLTAILGASFDLWGDNFLHELTFARIGQSGYFYLSDLNRIMISHPDKSRIMNPVLPVGKNKLYEKALSGFEGSGETTTTKGVLVLSSFRHLRTTGWILAASLPVGEAYAPLTAAKHYFILATMAVTIIVLLISWFLMKRLTRPLMIMTRHVESLPDTFGMCRLMTIDTNDEIGTLARAFNRMVSTLENRQTALRESEERFRRIVETSQEGIWTVDAELRTAYVNQRMADMLGYTAEQMIGRRILDFIVDAFIETVMANVEFRKKGMQSSYELELIHKDGEKIWVLLSGTPIFDQKGAFEGSFTMVTDITTRKQAEDALREREHFLQTIIDTEPECLKMLAPDGTLLMMNRAGLAMIGANSIDQVKGKSIYPLVDPRYRDAFISVTEGVFQGKAGGLEFLMIGLNGKQLWIDTHAVPFHNEHGEIVSLLAISRDITERKKVEQALHDKTLLLEQEIAERKTVQQALAIKQLQLEELNGSLEERIISAVNDLRQKDQALIQQSRLAVMGEMINNIAHQWRQPLNNIGLIVQALGINAESGELNRNEMCEDVDKIMNLIVFMSSTIDDFRNFFHLDKQRHSFSVNRSVNSVLGFIGASLKNSNIRVDLHTDEKVTVTGYRNEYAQVLLNILSNARDVLLERKASDPAIYVRIATEEGRSIVTISDNAGGIPEDILPRIFDPYFTTKEMGKGTGIGLYMSKVIIEQNMGGSLTACNVDDGAEFRIEV